MDPLTALETSTRIAAGDVGILDIVDAALEAAHADECHAWTWIDDTGARNTARKLQRQLDAGQARPGPLFGVPCPVKDLNALAGAPRAVGSRAVGGTPSDHDDGIVTRLKAPVPSRSVRRPLPSLGFPATPSRMVGRRPSLRGTTPEWREGPLVVLRPQSGLVRCRSLKAPTAAGRYASRVMLRCRRPQTQPWASFGRSLRDRRSRAGLRWGADPHGARHRSRS